jgi:hypothetical protein
LLSDWVEIVADILNPLLFVVGLKSHNNRGRLTRPTTDGRLDQANDQGKRGRERDQKQAEGALIRGK